MCKGNTCGCSGHSGPDFTASIGAAVEAAGKGGLYVVGLAVALTLIVYTVKLLLPWVIAAAAGAAAFRAGMWLWRVRHRRIVAARTVPAPVGDAPPRTMVTGMTVRSLGDHRVRSLPLTRPQQGGRRREVRFRP